MTGILALATLLAAADGACSGAAPVITSVTSHVAADGGSVDDFILHVTVANRGTQGQPANVLQSVSVYQNGGKVNEKGIPPLAAGASYAFDQSFQRSDESRAHTTRFAFRLHADKNASASCYGDGSGYKLSV